MKKLAPIIIFLSGCSMFQTSPSFTRSIPMPTPPSMSGSGFEILPWLGGIAVLTGLGLLVLSSGRRGWYPLLIGIGLIILNWIVLTYAHALFLPVVVATGAFTLAFGYKAVMNVLLHRKNGK
jgi:hypothetical protein